MRRSDATSRRGPRSARSRFRLRALSRIASGSFLHPFAVVCHDRRGVTTPCVAERRERAAGQLDDFERAHYATTVREIDEHRSVWVLAFQARGKGLHVFGLDGPAHRRIRRWKLEVVDRRAEV